MDVVRPQFGLRAPEDRGSRLFGYNYLENPRNSFCVEMAESGMIQKSEKIWEIIRS